ncbi:hypothetical protein ACXIVK_27855 [Paraburkholderia caledonica]|jgi:hypothetical protein
MDHKPNPIDDADAVKQLLLNLYLGWGYNAYRQENKDRAEDQLLRNGICGVLSEARAALTTRKSTLHQSIPTPSRDNPFPGADERAQIRDIERTIRSVEAVEALVRHQPVPENDRVWLRYRQEHEFLPRLIAADESMAQFAVYARQHAQGGAELGLVEDALSRLKDALSARRELLAPGMYQAKS